MMLCEAECGQRAVRSQYVQCVIPDRIEATLPFLNSRTLYREQYV